MAEHYGNTPRITYEFPDCSMPMAFDTYNNCSFGCMYCFAQNQRGIGSKKKEYLHKEVKDVSVERIKRMFIDPDKHGGDFAPYIKARKVMQWGSMSDQFDNFERKYGTTLELLRFFKDIDYPLCFSTKGAFNRGATALSTEFFCLETRSPTLRELLPTISKMAGFDILAFYKKYSVQSGYLRLNRKVKEPFFHNMKELCDQLGMRFYVSDAHFKELCHNGSCCGLPPTWNYSRGQFCEALNICKRKGYVRWSDIKLDAEIFLRAKLDKAMNMGTREKSSKYYTMSAADYMKWCWNNPQAAHSPYKMFEGAMLPADERDSEGNIVYKYNGAKF